MKYQILEKHLSNFLGKNKIVSIYSNYEDRSHFVAGFVKSFSEEDVIIKHISPEGYSDGIIVIKADDIFQIEYDGKYENRIEQLFKIFSNSSENAKNNNVESCSSLLDILEYSKNNRKIVTAFGEDFMAIASGFVESIEESVLTILKINEDGVADGKIVFFEDEIRRLSCMSIDEKILYELYCFKS